MGSACVSLIGKVFSVLSFVFVFVWLTSSFDVFIEYNRHLFSGFLAMLLMTFEFFDSMNFMFYVLTQIVSHSEAGFYWGFLISFYCCFCFSFRFL